MGFFRETPGFSPCGWGFHIPLEALGWLSGAGLGSHLWKSHKTETQTSPPHKPVSAWGWAEASQQILSVICAAWTRCSGKKDMEANRGGKRAVEKAEAFLCKSRT